MLTSINGKDYREMLDFGIRNLEQHCQTVNDLNVFPVPDGDTGTNMLMTLKNGYSSTSEGCLDISEVARSFAHGVIFGARGNSGVITSQFFKGISKGFEGHTQADCEILTEALDRGVKYAYSSVSTPVEGTILTVIREATECIKENISEFDSIDEMLLAFISRAKASLEQTPNLLPVLKKAGVVDSGGSVMVYFFEGINKYLNGESIEIDKSDESPVTVDYSMFNRHTEFELGYCTEILLQLTDDKDEFEYDEFVSGVSLLGDSLALSLEDDKVKVHIHTQKPEKVLRYCHNFGEFLSVKIENMSVQHTQRVQKYLCAEGSGECRFATVAVAPDQLLQNMFSQMGVDCCIFSPECPSSSEFIEAFEHTAAKEILVFPNSSNSILTAMQAASLYKGAKVTVLNCRSVAECYASLAMIDFDCDDIGEVVSAVNDTVRNIYIVSIVRASKNINYGKKSIVKNDFFALSGEDILVTGDRIEYVTLVTVRDVLRHRDCGVITVFYGKNISKSQMDKLEQEIKNMKLGVETCVIPTEDRIHDLTLSFE